LRQASGGLSAFTDYRGKVRASLDFYQPGTKLWYADIPVGRMQTIYSIIGDAVAYACFMITSVVLIYLLFISATGKINRKPAKKNATANNIA
jgi:apolipoprotein N-acyltransferase